MDNIDLIHIRKCVPCLIGLVALSLLFSGCGASPKVYHVGILSGLDFFADTADGFKAKMTELGYIEGKNIVYEMHKTNFEPDKDQQILKKFIADQVDLILTFPTEPSLEAKAATQGTKIPVLFANGVIEGVDLVKSVREPGGNITGVRYPGPEFAAKRLEFLHELVPQAKRVWVPYQKDYPIVPHELELLRPAAAAAGITLIEVPANNAADLKADLDARAQKADIGLDAMLIIPETMGVNPDAVVVMSNFAREHKVPWGGAYLPVGNAKCIFGISTDNIAMGKQTALLADKILKGIPAGTIPVVSGESYMIIDNVTAQSLGVTVPTGLLKMANQVIK